MSTTMGQYLPNFRLPRLSELLHALELDQDYEDDDDGEREEHGEEEDDDNDDAGDESDSDDEDEMEQIGRLPRLFNSGISFDYTNWLFARYLAPHGEPSGVMPAEEPDTPPLIQQVDPRDRTTRNTASSTPKTPIAISEQVIRRKIKELQERGLSERERDIEIQRLMTQNYYSKFRPEQHDHYEISDQDREATFTPDGCLGCEHYQRGCKLQCSTCFQWYTCRLCHDAVEDHKLIRPATDRIICMVCGTDQKAGNKCTNCTKTFARYYCDTCKLWDDESGKSIYHCPDCGICRIGQGLGIDLFHCQNCNVCMSIELQGNHRCIEHSIECDCPICGEFMFTSTKEVLFLKCGHAMHKQCYNEHVMTNYKCPTCSKTIINMEAQFRILDAEIQSQPLPDPYCNWRCIINCNDCHAKSNVPFHFLGLKCCNCRSYNTGQLKLIKPEELETLSTLPSQDLNETVNVSDLPSDDFDEEEDDEDEDYEEVFANLLSRVTRRL